MAEENEEGLKDALLQRRRIAREEQELQRLRAAHGARLAEGLSPLIDGSAEVKDFDIRVAPPFSVSWPKRLEDAPGLVAAYVSNQRAKAITSCIASSVGDLGGKVGIYGNSYLGLCSSSLINICRLVDAAKVVEDAVVFYPDGIDGAILVDFYSSNPGEPYSVLAQGAGLIERVKGCFD